MEGPAGWLHRKVEEQGHKEQQLEATIAQQQKNFQFAMV